MSPFFLVAASIIFSFFYPAFNYCALLSKPPFILLYPLSLQIRTIDRGIEIPHEGAFCDLVWSDPEDIAGWAVSPRGAGYLFGNSVTQEVRIRFNFLLRYKQCSNKG